MKATLRFFYLLVILVWVQNCTGQKQDYVWLSGYNSPFWKDSNAGYFFGITKSDFNISPRAITHDSLGMGFTVTNTSYCDSNGNLLFYTNGIYIANGLDEKIQNSDSLNPGYFQYVFDPDIQNIGYRTYNGILALEDPGKPNNYYVLHSFIDTIDANFTFFCKNIFVTYLDMNANGGHGNVLTKNQPVLSGYLGYEIKATSHANGRDWWILVQRRNTNCYERILLDAHGLHLLPQTCGGHAMGGLSGSACFSQDGSKYMYVSLAQGINIFDFDRCTGELSNAQYKALPIFIDSSYIGIGTAFSANNRFLYLNATSYCYQFDLWAADIWASVDTVARFDGATNPFGSYFHTMQIAPDGKIYAGCGNVEWVYHVIERPDEKGDSCLFKQHEITLRSFAGSCVPNFPNYRLGALPGSACDTLTGLNETIRAEKEKTIKLYPNPATEFVTIDYGFTDWNKGEISLEITNALGQLVYQQALPMYSGFQKIDVTGFASGFYTAYIKRNNQTVAAAKFARQ